MPTSMTSPTTNHDMYKKDCDMKTKANNFYHKREIKSSSGRNRDRETHHRYSYDLSSSSAKTSFSKTADGNNRPTIASKQSTNKSNSNKNRPLSPSSSASHKESKFVDYENLLKQFEKLKLKADFFADKDPEFAAKLINLANKITKSAPKMDSSFYPNSFYQRSPAYSTQSNYPTSNIYSTFNSNNFSHFNSHFSSQHLHTPPTNPPPPPPPPPRPPPIPPHVHRNPSNSKYPTENSNNFFANTNFSSFSYDNSQYNRHSQPSHTSSFDHNIYTQFFNYNYPHTDNSYKYSYSFAQERPEDLLLILEDPYDSSKITVQMTRTQVGPDGAQQRVTIERDFKSEIELNKFLKEFEENLNKTSSSIPSETKSPSFSNFFGKNQSSENDDSFKPGVVVVEEPGEEPILYRQDTGEMVDNGSFIDPLKKEQNNEYPSEVPVRQEDKRPKLYKDIDDIFKCEESQSVDSSAKLIDLEKSSVLSSSSSQNETTSKDLINFDDDLITEPTSEPKNVRSEPVRRTVRRAESFVMPKSKIEDKTPTKKDTNQKIHFRSSSTSIRKPTVAEPNEKPPLIKKHINIEPPKPAQFNEKSKIKVLNINKNSKQSVNENFKNIQMNKPVRPDMVRKEILEPEKVKPSSQFKHQYEKPLLSNHAKLGGEPAVSLKRHTSLLCQRTSYLENKEEKKSLNIPVSETEPVLLKAKKCEIKSRFSLRETRPNIKDNSRRYSQIYQKESDSDISTIHEEKKDEEIHSETNEKMLDEKKKKFIKNHRLMMSKKLSKSVDTGLSEKSSKYMKINKIEEKINQKNKNKMGSERNFCHNFNSESDEFETGNIMYGDESIKTSNHQLNYDYYSYDQTYSDGYYNFFNSTQSPAYFQPSFFNRPKSRIQEQNVSPQISTASQSQSSQAQPLYYPSYYTSWYGSAPSLRIQNQRVDNCQSIYFN